MKKRLRLLWLRLHRLHICQHEGCLEIGSQCHINEYEHEGDYHYKGESYYWYCPKHCQVEGFCWMCGEFWGGCESFDFDRGGLCPNCRSQVDEEMADELADLEEELIESGT